MQTTLLTDLTVKEILYVLFLKRQILSKKNYVIQSIIRSSITGILLLKNDIIMSFIFIFPTKVCVI